MTIKVIVELQARGAECRGGGLPQSIEGGGAEVREIDELLVEQSLRAMLQPKNAIECAARLRGGHVTGQRGVDHRGGPARLAGDQRSLHGQTGSPARCVRGPSSSQTAYGARCWTRERQSSGR